MKFETLKTCPSCGDSNLRPYQSITDHYFSKETFAIEECESCGLRFTQNRPSEGEIGRYYDSSNYASHESNKKSTFIKLYQMARDYMLGKKFELIRQFKPEWKKVLDYGTGEGFFVEYLLEKGKEATGIEPSEIARSNFKSRTGASLYTHIDELPMGQKYHVITLWHVLEHIHTLRETVQKIVNHMDAKGILVIAVPNQNSKDLAYFKENWAAWDVPRHLYHWDINSISHFIKSFNLKLIHTDQLPLDPIYIDFISSKYKKENPINGVLQGIKSYLHGKNNPEEGSTLLTIWMKD